MKLKILLLIILLPTSIGMIILFLKLCTPWFTGCDWILSYAPFIAFISGACFVETIIMGYKKFIK